MTPASWEELRAAIGGAEALLCDWDGCLAIGDRLLPNVAEALRAAPPFAIVSNNSTLPREAHRALLAAQGVAIDARHIHLAGDTMLRDAARHFEGQPVEVVAVPAMKAAAARLGLRLVDRDPAAVLLLRDTAFDFATLERVSNHVRAGAQFWVANGDVSHPLHDGVTPETGALAAAIGAIACRVPDRVTGKPAARLFDAALSALGVAPSAALMIGDNPATDIAGARALGLGACLVDGASWIGGGLPLRTGRRLSKMRPT